MAWYESGDFWRLGARFFFRPEAWEQARHEVDAAIRHLGIAPGDRVLDLCCGPGRHSLEFARRGFRATAADRNASYLEAFRSACQSEGLEVEVVEMDMREFSRPDTFDGAINLFTSFGYFDDPDDDRRAVRGVHSSLKPGGRFIIDVMGREPIVRGYQPRSWEEVEGAFMLEERTLDLESGQVRSRWVFVTDEERQEFSTRLRLYTGTELSSLLRSCGFREVELYGDFDGRPYDLNARRLIALATK